jgi:hypothetical protein
MCRAGMLAIHYLMEIFWVLDISWLHGALLTSGLRH